jgi:glycosyltransferase 2 family protein
MRRLFAFAVKATLSALLLYLALQLVSFGDLQQRFNRLDVGWIVIGLSALMAQIALVAVRWQVIAGRCGATFPIRQSLLYTLIGQFFGQMLPVGGDAARIWLLARAAGHWKYSVYSVLVDRAAGLIWLAVLVLACLPWSIRLIENPIGRMALVLIGAGGVIGPLVLFALTHLGRKELARWRVTRHISEISAIAWQTLASARTGGFVAATSIAIHLMTVLIVWFAAKAIGSPLEFVQSLLLVPPVILIAAVPISIAGWGLREGAMIAAFSYAGLPNSDGLAISVLYGAGVFAIGAIGGLSWVLSGERGRPIPTSTPTLPHAPERHHIE